MSIIAFDPEKHAVNVIERAMLTMTGMNRANNLPRASLNLLERPGAPDGEIRYTFQYGGLKSPFEAAGTVTLHDQVNYTVVIEAFHIHSDPSKSRYYLEYSGDHAVLDAIHPNPATPDHVGAEAAQF